MRRIIILVIVFLFVFPTGLGKVSPSNSYNHNLDVYFLNIGQGDATLVVLPNQKVILIDGGPIESGKELLRVLHNLKIKKIDLLIATHPDIDHIGGLTTVLRKIKVDRVLDSGKTYNTQTYFNYKKLIKKKDIPLKKAKEGKYIKLDPTVKIQILNDAKEKEENNESSIVLKITYQNADILLTGDADVFVEEQILSKGYHISADILKVGHHGSYTSTSPRFLEQVHPIYAIISSAKNNEYGHPHKRVLERLKEQNVKIYRTAQIGTISVHTDGNRLTIGDSEQIILTDNK